jgi:hypothetical protein
LLPPKFVQLSSTASSIKQERGIVLPRMGYSDGVYFVGG